MKLLDSFYIYIFFSLSFILLILSMRIAWDTLSKILFPPLQEGLNVGNEIKKAFDKPFKEVKQAGEKTFRGITDIIGFVKKIFDDLKNIGKFLGSVFVSIGSYLDCGVFYIGNIFSTCIIYYFFYIFGLIVYAPFSFLFWVTGTKYIEDFFWDIMGSVNDFTSDITGFDILDYIYPDKCYKCHIKPMPKLRL